MDGLRSAWLKGSDREVKSIILEMQAVAFHQQLPDCHLFDESAKIQFFEIATGGVVCALSAWLLDGHKVDVREERDHRDFPSSPWQFFKLRYAPQWFKNRFPVKSTREEFVVSIHHHHLCPHVKTETSEQRNQHFMWMAQMSGQVEGGAS